MNGGDQGSAPPPALRRRWSRGPGVGGRPGAGRGTGTPPPRLGRAGGSGWSRWLRPGAGGSGLARGRCRRPGCPSVRGFVTRRWGMRWGQKLAFPGGGGGTKKKQIPHQ